jgi:hypothetical protein
MSVRSSSMRRSPSPRPSPLRRGRTYRTCLDVTGRRFAAGSGGHSRVERMRLGKYRSELGPSPTTDDHSLPIATDPWPIATMARKISPLPRGEGQGEGKGTPLPTFHSRIISDRLPPMNPSRNALSRYLERAADKRAALEDITWAIVNSKEFVMRH